jgi:hypothetical protein
LNFQLENLWQTIRKKNQIIIFFFFHSKNKTSQFNQFGCNNSFSFYIKLFSIF